MPCYICIYKDQNSTSNDIPCDYGSKILILKKQSRNSIDLSILILEKTLEVNIQENKQIVKQVNSEYSFKA